MDYEQFLEQVKADLQEQFPFMNVEIRSVEKLQGQSYTGISITPEGSNAGATMNLHSQYEMLQDGVPMDIVMRRIENLAADAVNQIPQVEASTLSDYEQMKHTLIMQAVPVGPNRALLETIPHRTMEDIAIVYRFQLEHRENADATHNTDEDTCILTSLRGYGQDTVIYMVQIADIFHIHLVKLKFRLHGSPRKKWLCVSA